ncbi:MAG TPA: GNAT family N-acetyltransferase [Verrucomicrobiae bacterium]|nr:GNAT family N-acetyltransferase [Verrucomicrobiae bacterium]
MSSFPKIKDLQIQRCSESDFLEILSRGEEFWGSHFTRTFHHPIFLREFGDTAFVVRDQTKIVGYLFGFISQTEPAAYVHLVATDPSARRQGIARKLYDHFLDLGRQRGCTKLKTITTVSNKDSIAFHASLGMKAVGESNGGSVPIVENYSGPGEDRIVFYKEI